MLPVVMRVRARVVNAQREGGFGASEVAAFPKQWSRWSPSSLSQTAGKFRTLIGSIVVFTEAT